MKRDCYTCRFWNASSHGDGERRRHPPRIMLVPDSDGDDPELPGMQTLWPMTDQEDWCGEWAFRDVPHGKVEWETGAVGGEIVEDGG